MADRLLGGPPRRQRDLAHSTENPQRQPAFPIIGNKGLFYVVVGILIVIAVDAYRSSP